MKIDTSSDAALVRDLCYNHPKLAKKFIKHMKNELKKTEKVIKYLNKQF